MMFVFNMVVHLVVIINAQNFKMAVVFTEAKEQLKEELDNESNN